MLVTRFSGGDEYPPGCVAALEYSMAGRASHRLAMTSVLMEVAEEAWVALLCCNITLASGCCLQMENSLP